MDITQILNDISKFKKIIAEEGLIEYSVIGSLLLELCLKSHGINNSIKLGYLVDSDKYWLFHICNIVELDGEIYQLDVLPVPPIIKYFGQPLKYSPILKDKWKSLINEKFPEDQYSTISDNYNIYLKKGPQWWLQYEINNSITGIYRKIWKFIIKRVKKLKTFNNIENFMKLGKLEKYCH